MDPDRAVAPVVDFAGAADFDIVPVRTAPSHPQDILLNGLEHGRAGVGERFAFLRHETAEEFGRAHPGQLRQLQRLREEAPPLRAEAGEQRILHIGAFKDAAVLVGETVAETLLIGVPEFAAGVQIEKIDLGDRGEVPQEIQIERRHGADPEHADPHRHAAPQIALRHPLEEFAEPAVGTGEPFRDFPVQLLLPHITPRFFAAPPRFEQVAAVDLVLVEQIGDAPGELPPLADRFGAGEIAIQFRPASGGFSEQPEDPPRGDLRRKDAALPVERLQFLARQQLPHGL